MFCVLFVAGARVVCAKKKQKLTVCHELPFWRQILKTMTGLQDDDRSFERQDDDRSFERRDDDRYWQRR